MIVSKKAVDFIITCEVTSKAVYDKKYQGLIWPGGESGVTIGIGYDLGYQSAQSIENDWVKEIGAHQVSILKMFAGLRGTKAQLAMVGNKLAPQISVPFQAACNIFIKRSLPKYGRMALQVYPGLDELTPDAAGAIVSLVYNRGTNLQGDRRAEMRAIVPLVVDKDYHVIAEQLESMKRLWDNGLVERREKEAALVRNSVRQYAQDELITI